VTVRDNRAQRREFKTLTQTDKYQRQNEFGHVCSAAIDGEISKNIVFVRKTGDGDCDNI